MTEIVGLKLRYWIVILILAGFITLPGYVSTWGNKGVIILILVELALITGFYLFDKAGLGK